LRKEKEKSGGVTATHLVGGRDKNGKRVGIDWGIHSKTNQIIEMQNKEKMGRWLESMFSTNSGG